MLADSQLACPQPVGILNPDLLSSVHYFFQIFVSFTRPHKPMALITYRVLNKVYVYLFIYLFLFMWPIFQAHRNFGTASVNSPQNPRTLWGENREWLYLVSSVAAHLLNWPILVEDTSIQKIHEKGIIHYNSAVKHCMQKPSESNGYTTQLRGMASTLRMRTAISPAGSVVWPLLSDGLLHTCYT